MKNKLNNKTSLSILILLIFLALDLVPKKGNCQISDMDGNAYSATKIGDKAWLTENLKVTRFRNGDEIPVVSSFEEWNNYNKAQKPACCYYRFDPVYGMQFGVLYNFYAVSDPREPPACTT